MSGWDWPWLFISTALVCTTASVLVWMRFSQQQDHAASHSANRSSTQTSPSNSMRARAANNVVEADDDSVSRLRKRARRMVGMTSETLSIALGEEEASFDVDNVVSMLLQYCNDDERLEGCLRRLIADRDDADAFFDALQQGNVTAVCAYTFKANEPAFQCRTCGVDPTCIQCMACFRDANHDGHDIIMTHAGGGGCCDCGDVSSWSIDGCCSKHRGEVVHDADRHVLSARGEQALASIVRLLCNALLQANNCFLMHATLLDSEELLTLEEPQIVFIFNDEVHTFDEVIATLESLHHSHEEAQVTAFRTHNRDRSIVSVCSGRDVAEVVDLLTGNDFDTSCEELNASVFLLSYDRATTLLSFLIDLCRTSHLLRKFIVNEFLQSRRSSAPSSPSSSSSSSSSLEGRPQTSFMSLLLLASFSLPLPTSKALSELQFQLFSDMNYKELFTLEFTKQYRDLVSATALSGSPSPLDLSVQLYTIPDIVLQLVRREASENILSILLRMILDVMHEEPFFEIIDIESSNSGFFHNVFTDLEYIVSIDGVCRYLLQERCDIVLQWCEVLRVLERVDLQRRQRNVHVEYENASWIVAFRVCFRAFHITSHLSTALRDCIWSGERDASSWLKDLVAPLVSVALEGLQTPTAWEQVDDGSVAPLLLPRFSVAEQEISFHYPLTRFVVSAAMEYCQKTGVEFASLFTLVPAVSDGRCVSKFLLLADRQMQLLAASAHMKASLWVLNGTSIELQTHNYFRVGLRESMFDADLQSLQALCVVMGGNAFVWLLFYRFLLHRWLDPSLQILSPSQIPDATDKKLLTALDSLMHILVYILSERAVVSGCTKERNVRRHVIHRLMSGEMSYSALLALIHPSSRDAHSAPLQRVLDEVADFIRPQRMDNGRFRLKAEFTVEFDPFFMYYEHDERQRAEEHFLREAKKVSGAVLFPPTPKFVPLLPNFLRLLEMLSSPMLQNMIFRIFSRPNRRSTSSLFSSLRLLQIGLVDAKAEFLHAVVDLTFTPTDDHDLSSVNGKASVLHALCSLVHSENVLLRPHLNLARHLVTSFVRLKASASNTAVLFNLDTSTTDTSRVSRRRIARERALARMEAQKRRFADSHRDDLEAMARDDDDAKNDSHHVCIVCKSAEDQSSMGLLAWVGRSRLHDLTRPTNARCARAIVSSHTGNSGNPSGSPPGNPPGNPSGNPPGNPSGNPSGNPLGNPSGNPLGNPSGNPLGNPPGNPPGNPSGNPLGNPPGNPGNPPENPPGNPPGNHDALCFVQFCGHAMHAVCHATHIATVIGRDRRGVFYEGRLIVDINDDEIICPLCKCGANALVPGFVDGDGDGDEGMDARFVQRLVRARNNDDQAVVTKVKAVHVAVLMRVLADTFEGLELSARLDAVVDERRLTFAGVLLRSIGALLGRASTPSVMDALAAGAGSSFMRLCSRMILGERGFPEGPWEDAALQRRATLLHAAVTMRDDVELASASELEPVRLMTLPSSYADLFQVAAEGRCTRCMQHPVHPALCLVCGELLCASTRCCASNGVAELSQHARDYCGDQAMFLMLNESVVLFLFNGYDITFFSPYLDVHGEEDIGLRRGRPLYLDQGRWLDIQRIFTRHEIGSYVSRKRSYESRLYRRFAH